MIVFPGERVFLSNDNHHIKVWQLRASGVLVSPACTYPFHWICGTSHNGRNVAEWHLARPGYKLALTTNSKAEKEQRDKEIARQPFEASTVLTGCSSPHPPPFEAAKLGEGSLVVMVMNSWPVFGESFRVLVVAAVAEWYRYRTVACFVTGSSPVPLKTRRVGQRCTLNLSRAETSSRCPRVAEQCDVNINSTQYRLSQSFNFNFCASQKTPSPRFVQTVTTLDTVVLKTPTKLAVLDMHAPARTATAGSDVVQSGRPIFDDFFQHLWPYIGNNTANVVFQMFESLWLIRIDQ
ncbi:hypothetical protein TNCV_3008311 [Trichonephila clavipes]|nr:hypothetical protein TNCV_3008311 [Trichonephila clavipes]